MAKYPDTHSKYPATPKAYPVSPKAYPGTVNAYPSGTAFSPSSVSGGLAWFDMQDAAAFTQAGGLVTTITNKFSSVVWAEATNRPTYSATGLNGFPCADFDGTNDRFIDTEAAVVAGLKDQLDNYIAMVVQADDLDAIEVIFGVANSAQAGAVGSKRWGTNTTGAGRWTVIGTNDASTPTTVDYLGANTVTDPVLLEFYCETQATSVRVNGGVANPSGTATAYGALTPNRAALGCRCNLTPATFFNGRLGELIAYGAVSDANKALIRAYLIAKWSIV